MAFSLRKSHIANSSLRHANSGSARKPRPTGSILNLICERWNLLCESSLRSLACTHCRRSLGTSRPALHASHAEYFGFFPTSYGIARKNVSIAAFRSVVPQSLFFRSLTPDPRSPSYSSFFTSAHASLSPPSHSFSAAPRWALPAAPRPLVRTLRLPPKPATPHTAFSRKSTLKTPAIEKGGGNGNGFAPPGDGTHSTSLPARLSRACYE